MFMAEQFGNTQLIAFEHHTCLCTYVYQPTCSPSSHTNFHTFIVLQVLYTKKSFFTWNYFSANTNYFSAIHYQLHNASMFQPNITYLEDITAPVLVDVTNVETVSLRNLLRSGKFLSECNAMQFLQSAAKAQFDMQDANFAMSISSIYSSVRSDFPSVLIILRIDMPNGSFYHQ
jgi:hypothetical protein